MENFRSQCLGEFKNLFKQTQNQNENQFLISLLGIRKEEFKDRSLLTIPYTQEMEFGEVCRTTNLFIRIIDGINLSEESEDKNNERNVIALKLFVYCHLIEVDFYYNINYRIEDVVALHKDCCDLSCRRLVGKNRSRSEIGTKRNFLYVESYEFAF